ncbi:MAG: ASKHA domain-containing protein [Syntrophobacteraceae bacterium]
MNLDFMARLQNLPPAQCLSVDLPAPSPMDNTGDIDRPTRALSTISEIEIGIFLKSKAAMYTILSVISGKVGLRFDEIRKISIAGSFGNRIDPEWPFASECSPIHPWKPIAESATPVYSAHRWPCWTGHC